TFRIDLFTTSNTLPKTTLSNARESALHHSQDLAVVVALVEEKFFGVRTGGAIGDVLRRILIYCAAVLLGARNRTAQLLLPGFEFLFNMLQLLLVHRKYFAARRPLLTTLS